MLLFRSANAWRYGCLRSVCEAINNNKYAGNGWKIFVKSIFQEESEMILEDLRIMFAFQMSGIARTQSPLTKITHPSC